MESLSPFTQSRVCEDAKKENSINRRTRPEIHIKTDEGEFLVEISPDIRIQSSKFNLSNIKDFFISHWHFDHMYGLLELHAHISLTLNKEFNIYCSQKTKEWLDINFAHIPKNVIILEPYKKISFQGIFITPIPVYHMKFQDDNLSEDELNNTFGFIFEKVGKKVVYLADYYKLPQKTIDLIRGSDIVIADGTYLLEEEFPNKPFQNGVKEDPDHLHGKEIIEIFNDINPKQVIFHSISHLSEKTHEEIEEKLPEHMKCSFDGMEF